MFSVDVSVIGDKNKAKNKGKKNKIVIEASTSFISNFNEMDDYNNSWGILRSGE